MDFDYEEDLAIDPEYLDKEWLKQANLYGNYGDLEAEAARAKDDAKSRMDQTGAELELKIRKKPTDFGLEKATDKTVAAAVLDQQVYMDAIDEYNQSKYAHKVASNVLTAFEHRKKALENLVHLYSSGYFAGPKEPHTLDGGKAYIKKAREDKEADLVDERRKSLNKNKKRRRRDRDE